jgi:hypothetical protein
MSYCRWSSDNFKCDVYCYEDVSGGFTTHVAGNRILGDIPDCPPFPIGMDTVEWKRLYDARRAFMATAEHSPIGLPYDNQSFNDDDLEGMRDRLRMLKQIGYHVPEWVFETIADELAASNSPSHNQANDATGKDEAP